MSVTASSLSKLFDIKELEEKCGVILKDGTVVPTHNLHHKPQEGFVVDPIALLRYEDDLWGTWHTHPKANSNLSSEDYQGFLQWPELKHFIIGVDGIRCYVVEDGLIIEESFD